MNCTKFQIKVYPQLEHASRIASCGTAGVAFGGVRMKSTFASFSHHSCQRALYASRRATNFHCSYALFGPHPSSNPAHTASRRTYLTHKAYSHLNGRGSP